MKIEEMRPLNSEPELEREMIKAFQKKPKEEIAQEIQRVKMELLKIESHETRFHRLPEQPSSIPKSDQVPTPMSSLSH